MKAILEIEMPDSCIKCPLCTGSYYSPAYYCGILTIKLKECCQVADEAKRREDCPLKPVE